MQYGQGGSRAKRRNFEPLNWFREPGTTAVVKGYCISHKNQRLTADREKHLWAQKEELSVSKTIIKRLGFFFFFFTFTHWKQLKISTEWNLLLFCSFTVFLLKKNNFTAIPTTVDIGLGLVDWAVIGISLFYFCYLVGPRVSRWDHKPLSSQHVLLLFLRTQHAASEDVVFFYKPQDVRICYGTSWVLMFGGSAELQTLVTISS